MYRNQKGWILVQKQETTELLMKSSCKVLNMKNHRSQFQSLGDLVLQSFEH